MALEADLLEAAKLIAVLATAGVTLYKLGGAIKQFEMARTTQDARMDRIEKTLEKLGDTVTTMASEKARLDFHESRLDRIEKYWDELRRGEGMVLPPELNSLLERLRDTK